jgi:hypothetical protein
MFCKKCGAKLDDDAAFCDKCGTAIKRAVASNEPSPVQTPNSENAAAKDIIIESQNLTPTNSGKKRPIIFVAVVIAIIVIAVVASLFLGADSSNSSTSDPRAESNFNNGAEMAFDADTLYFVGLFDDDDSETCVYSTSYEGTNKTLISDNPDINKIRIVNDKILYEISGDDTYCIGTMDKDGSNDSVIIELDRKSDDQLSDLSDFDASSSSLYYLYNDELRTCSMDGTNDSLLLDGVEEFIMVGNTLYYTTEESIFSYDIKKGQSTEICNSEASRLLFDDGRIYFKNDSGIYSVASTGDESAQLVVEDSYVGTFLLDGETIYYVQRFDNDTLLDLAKYLDEDDYTVYVMVLRWTGQVECVSKLGGTPTEVDSDQADLSAVWYVYPDGMYSKLSLLSDTMSRVEFE